jgi:hypothetical protein
VYDAKRNYVYGLRSGAIDVADLTTGAARPSILFPYPTSGADISLGGDTLLIAVGGRKFAIVNLVTSQVDTVAFAQPGSPGAQGDVAVLANGRAFFAINDFSAAKVVSYDLATGAQATRSDVGPGPALSPSIAFARSGDGTHLLLLRSTTCCPLPAQLYSTATDQFGTEVGTADHIAVLRASGDQTGGRWLLDDELFDGGLSLVRQLSAAAHILFTTGPTAVAGDGRSVVLGTMDGFLRLDAATGAQLEHVLMTEFPARLLLLPGDTTLVGTGGLSSGKLYVVHLLH